MHGAMTAVLVCSSEQTLFAYMTLFFVLFIIYVCGCYIWYFKERVLNKYFCCLMLHRRATVMNLGMTLGIASL